MNGRRGFLLRNERRKERKTLWFERYRRVEQFAESVNWKG